MYLSLRVRAEADDGRLVAVAVAELGRAGRPGAVVEAGARQAVPWLEPLSRYFQTEPVGTSTVWAPATAGPARAMRKTSSAVIGPPPAAPARCAPWPSARPLPCSLAGSGPGLRAPPATTRRPPGLHRGARPARGSRPAARATWDCCRTAPASGRGDPTRRPGAPAPARGRPRTAAASPVAPAGRSRRRARAAPRPGGCHRRRPAPGRARCSTPAVVAAGARWLARNPGRPPGVARDRAAPAHARRTLPRDQTAARGIGRGQHAWRPAAPASSSATARTKSITIRSGSRRAARS